MIARRVDEDGLEQAVETDGMGGRETEVLADDEGFLAGVAGALGLAAVNSVEEQLHLRVQKADVLASEYLRHKAASWLYHLTSDADGLVQS